VPISPIHSHHHFTTTSPQSQIHHHPITQFTKSSWTPTSLCSCSSHCRQAKRTTLRSYNQSITAPKLHSLCKSVPPSSHEVHADITHPDYHRSSSSSIDVAEPNSPSHDFSAAHH
jgi:hypothetical protein